MPAIINEPKIYLNITFGKFRQRASEGNKNARERVTKEGKTIHEIVYDALIGKVTNIYFKEDADFGNSFEVTVDDGTEKFQVSFKEGDNFFNDFFSKLSNVNLNEEVKLVPYAFEDKTTKKNKRGLTIWQNNQKVENYFQVKEGEEFVYLHGFPKPDSSNMDTEDWKIYFIKVTKFLRNYIQQTIISQLKNPTNESTENKDDLPF